MSDIRPDWTGNIELFAIERRKSLLTLNKVNVVRTSATSFD